MRQFVETRIRFEAATGCTYPLTYNAWVVLPDGLKAAALYVNFYDQITLAWTKAKADYTSDEEGIGTVMQYLLKNVPIIELDHRKFTPNYIYRVAYNCMGCLRRIDRDRKRHETCISQFQESGGDEIDLFTMIPDDNYVEDMVYDHDVSREFWTVVESLDGDSRKLAKKLLEGGSVGKLTKKKADTIDELKHKLVKYRFKDSTRIQFSDVLALGDLVSSAVVVMRDGTSAVFYGETRVSHNGGTDAVFYGPEYDYFVPIEQTSTLIVRDVEFN